MKSNNEIVTAFCNHTDSKNRNMESICDKLYSYSTCIAQYINGKLVVNLTKYSQTTSKQQKLLPKGDITLYNIPRNSDSLNKFV